LQTRLLANPIPPAKFAEICDKVKNSAATFWIPHPPEGDFLNLLNPPAPNA
jgi:hypothetical protein